MDILRVGRNNINLDDASFNGDDPKVIIHFRLLSWHNKFEKCKAFKKVLSKELMSEARHPTRWCDWCMSEDEKKETEPFFIDEK